MRENVPLLRALRCARRKSPVLNPSDVCLADATARARRAPYTGEFTRSLTIAPTTRSRLRLSLLLSHATGAATLILGQVRILVIPRRLHRRLNLWRHVRRGARTHLLSRLLAQRAPTRDFLRHRLEPALFVGRRGIHDDRLRDR